MRNQKVNLLYKKITPLVFWKISVFIVQSSLLCWRNGVCHIEESKNYKAFAGPFIFLHRHEPFTSFLFFFSFFFLLYFFLVANTVKMSCSNVCMAYFHWTRSTRANSCSEEKDMLLCLLKGQGLRPIAAVRQHVEITKFRSPMLTQDTGIPSMGRRRLWGFKVLLSCYKYSSSKAWWRAIRSEWLEILQNGIACCEQHRQHVKITPSVLVFRPTHCLSQR